jgi:hypothetical protein
MLLSHRTNVLLDTELYGILREQSKKTGKSVGQILREAALKQYVKKKNKIADNPKLLTSFRKIRRQIKELGGGMTLEEILKYRDDGRR